MTDKGYQSNIAIDKSSPHIISVSINAEKVRTGVPLGRKLSNNVLYSYAVRI